jgi:hypothetical protein
LDKIAGILLISLLAIVSITSLSYYIVSQPNQTQNTPSPTPTPASTPTFTPVPTAEPTLAYDYVVYEWYLKAEYINNVTWLNWSMAAVTVGDEIRSTNYDSSKTWSENYIAYVNHFEDIPQQVADSDSMGPISKWSFIRQLSVNASFNEATGYTKAFCQYAEYEDVPFQYGIELELPLLADDRGWTKAFV